MSRNLVGSSAKEIRRFVDSYDTIITDCDGVLWLYNKPIAGALEVLNKLESLGKKIFFVSNNNTMMLDEYCAKLKKMGYNANLDQIANPVRATCWYLKKIGFNGKVFATGNKKFFRVLQEENIVVAETGSNHMEETFGELVANHQILPDVKAVILDIDLNLNWAKLSRAIQYLKNSQVLYLVGALDRKIPATEKMTLLGLGGFVDIVSQESGREPIECGKPSKVMRDYIKEKFSLNNPRRCLFIGDTFESDMKFADMCGFDKLWVGSGIDKQQQQGPSPHYYLSSLGSLSPLLDSLDHE